METKEAVKIFTALAQETRLSVYKIIVAHSPAGVCPCEIADTLNIPRNTLSFHLSLLSH
jgi:DNA-binding transcriptional ArsR family regulator